MKNDEEQVQFLASRWAIKEALNKAIGRKELVFNEIYIAEGREGSPGLT
jgi:phosphopantetheinyl transferase (holo-ACP synthase)